VLKSRIDINNDSNKCKKPAGGGNCNLTVYWKISIVLRRYLKMSKGLMGRWCSFLYKVF